MFSGPVQTAEDISRVGFAFMASKALFAALHLGVFDALADGPRRPGDLAAGGAAVDRMTTLLTALVAAGLVETDGERFTNAPATQEFMVRGAPGFFGDYLRLQIDRQMYPMLTALEPVMRSGRPPADKASYAAWMDDPHEARLFSESQHAGSVGPGRQLAKRLTLAPGDSVLDVGGGTGAFAAQIARRHPGVRVTVMDFAHVIAVGRELAARDGGAEGVAFVAGDALTTPFPGDHAAVVMSYLWSGVGAPHIPNLLAKAKDALRPGGVVAVHDFMVDDDRRGPPLAALWALQHMVFTPEGRALTPGFATDVLTAAGFVDVEVQTLIPGMTRLATARRPDA